VLAVVRLHIMFSLLTLWAFSSDFWPFWFMAVLVCGHFGRGRFGLWPFWTSPVSGRCLYCYVRPPTFLIWNSLCDLIYQTPTKTYRSQIPVAFGIPGHVTTKHLPDTPC